MASGSPARGLRSMTGCGEATHTEGRNTCRVELRVVNNRFFKFSLRARDGFSVLEGRAEAVVRGRVRRGAVQMTLDIVGPAAPVGRRLDSAQLAAYLDAAADFCLGRELPAPRSVEPFLQLPGVFVDDTADGGAAEQVWPLVSRTLADALDGLDRMRIHEGDVLAADLRGSCREIGRLAAVVAERVPRMVADHGRRLADRVAKLLEPQAVPLAPTDLAREVALLADRSDVAEELVRLGSHLQQFDRLLGEEAPGRSLDFLTQELAREANTIASKSPDVEIAHTVVAIKTCVERLREQVQNIE